MKKLILLIPIISLVVSCSKEKPALVYMPNMYYPVAYDPYSDDVWGYSDEENTIPLFQKQGGQTALYPVEGTVFRNAENILPTDLKDTPEDYLKSKTITTSPLDPANRKQDLARGKKLYELGCLVCHGAAGDGQGPIVASGAYAGVPKYSDRELTVGSIHYVILYGRNAMGSYAGDFNAGDRWRIAEYVMSEFMAKAAPATETATATPATNTNTTTVTK